jgi:hypothetical protein
VSGPKHYREAERLLVDAWVPLSEWDSTNHGRTREELLLAAQVHATLAVAAATALKDGNGEEWEEWDGWQRGAGGAS